MTPEATIKAHDSHDERFNPDCPICDIAMALAGRARDSTGVDEAAIKQFKAEQRLAHCTPNAWSEHYPLCDRDGNYCSKVSTHDGPCAPHGAAIPESERRALWGDR